MKDVNESNKGVHTSPFANKLVDIHEKLEDLIWLMEARLVPIQRYHHHTLKRAERERVLPYKHAPSYLLPRQGFSSVGCVCTNKEGILLGMATPQSSYLVIPVCYTFLR